MKFFSNKRWMQDLELMQSTPSCRRREKGGARIAEDGLLKECMKKIDSKYQKEAIKMVKSGELWDNPKILLHYQTGIDMRKSWKDFHKL
jgi:hypothetical protein